MFIDTRTDELLGGVDENGLGPKAGPLVITGVVVRGKPEKFEESKKFFSPGEWRKLEEVTLPILRKFYEVETLLDIFQNSLFSSEVNQICPVKPSDFCFSRIKLPFWSAKAESSPFDAFVVELKFAVLCPGILSVKVGEEGSKYKVDAKVMFEVAKLLSAKKVVCGKAGFTKSYIFDSEIEVLKEGGEESIYKVGDKTISFVKKADEKFFPVAVASLVGKYIRELCMLSLSQNFGFDFVVSGYPSGKGTYELIGKMKEKLPEECCERNY